MACCDLFTERGRAVHRPRLSVGLSIQQHVARPSQAPPLRRHSPPQSAIGRHSYPAPVREAREATDGTPYHGRAL